MLLVDAHVHIYPGFQVDRAMRAARQNLELGRWNSRLDDPRPVGTLCLAESADCDWFAQTRELRGSGVNGVVISYSEQRELLDVEIDGDLALHICPGRQINSRERLEFLAIGTDHRIPNGLPWRELVERILDQGALPVLNWAPGKWLFARAAEVTSVLEAGVKNLCLCDTTLRPVGWTRPAPMDRARSLGIPVLAGSDPLPLANEEYLIGSYGLAIPWDLTGSEWIAKTQLLERLVSGNSRVIGRRSNPFSWANRMLRYYSTRV